MYKIMASTNLRNKYNQVSEVAKKEPVILTKNGKADVIVMGVDFFKKKELEQKEKEMELEFYKQAFEDEKDFQEGRFVTAKEMSETLSRYITEDLPGIRENVRKQFS